MWGLVRPALVMSVAVESGVVRDSQESGVARIGGDGLCAICLGTECLGRVRAERPVRSGTAGSVRVVTGMLGYGRDG